MTALLSLDSTAATVMGTVSDPARNDAPIAGANVDIEPYILMRDTDEDGHYALPPLPVDDYTLTFTAADYLPHTEDISIEEAGELELNVGLLHATCDPSVDVINTSLEPDMDVTLDFSVANNGNGPLTYRVVRQLRGERSTPWEVREEMAVEEILGNTRLSGVAMVDGQIYVAGGGGARDTSWVYILNRAGELVGRFQQFIASTNGMRDLTYDGRLIWGTDGPIVYGFTPQGELETSFELREDPIMGMAWDPDDDVLWICRATGRMYSVTTGGEAVQNFPRLSNDLTINALDYYPDDPDGYNLYAFCRSTINADTSDLIMVKMNTADGSWRLVRDLQVGELERPGGLCITTAYDSTSWVAMGVITQSGGDIPNRLTVWQLDDRRNWMAVNPEAGVIDNGEEQEFSLTLNSGGMPEMEMEGELVFIHDGVHGRTAIPVNFNIAQGHVHTTRTLNLALGWNMTSIGLQPDEEDVTVPHWGLVDAGQLIIMKDGAGNFYWPARDFNDIPGWDVQQGYLMKMTAPARLILAGWSMMRDDTLSLHEGWQIAAYYPRQSVEATIALSGITDHLIISKDGLGNFYVPAWEFSNLGRLREGQGYQMLLDADVELIYDDGRDRAPGRGVRYALVYDAPGSLPVVTPTGFNQSLLVKADRGVTGEIGVYASGLLVGSGVLKEGACGIAVWGDDPTTEAVDGAVEGQALELRRQDELGSCAAVYETLSGETTYQTDGFTAIRLAGDTEIPTEFGIVAAYPNPFNASARLTYGLPEVADARLTIYDVLGREVAVLTAGVHSAGVHAVTFDGSRLSSGIYIARLEAAGRVSHRKLTLVK